MHQIKNIYTHWVEKMDGKEDIEIVVRSDRDRKILLNTFSRIYPKRDDLKRKLRGYISVDPEQGVKA